jgi:hypothetical protein
MYARILALEKLLDMFASDQKDNHLLLVLISGIVTTTSGGGTSALSLRSARSATSIWRGESEVDVLLRIKTDDKRRNVYDLFTNTNVTLTDENTGMVNRFSETRFEDLSLKSSLHEIFYFESEYVIETHACLV